MLQLTLASVSTSDLAAGTGGVFILILGAVLIANGVLWLFLPFVLISKLNEVIRRLKSIEAESESIARHTRRAEVVAESSVGYRTGPRD
jgi:hypothetical protein